jgi:hypothetical protein
MTALLRTLFGNEKLARIAAYVLIALLLLAILIVAKCAYDDSIIRQHELERREKLNSNVRKADDAIITTITAGDAQIARDEKEQRDAVQSKPVEPLTARQRARACSILLRQARETGTRPPASCTDARGTGAAAKP